VTACCLAVEFKAARLQFLDDFPISESCQATHLRGDHDHVVTPLSSRRKAQSALALASSFNQFACDVARDIEGLGNCPALRDETGEFFRGCEKR